MMDIFRRADAYRVGKVIFGARRSFAAKDFNPLVIAIDGFTAVIYGTNRTALEFERDQGGINIPGCANGWINQHPASSIDFVNLAQQEACHVKIVDSHIEEDAARYLHILNRRRSRGAADYV